MVDVSNDDLIPSLQGTQESKCQADVVGGGVGTEAHLFRRTIEEVG